MLVSADEQQGLDGEKGRVFQKVMKTLVQYGEALDAERFVDIEWGGQFSIPFALPGIGMRMEMLDELVDAGLRTTLPFTLDPKAPYDFDALGVSEEQKQRFDDMLVDQPSYDDRMLKLGLKGEEFYTCTPYLPGVGVNPPEGTILAWSESSCVVYANSVLGARTNRNSSILDLLSNIAGKTPLTGLLTDEGRRANWLIDVRTKSKPNPKLLGAAIGKKVMEDVPFIAGLDEYLDVSLSPQTIDFLKDLGASCAALGAIGLFHVEGVTPEARRSGRDLLMADHQIYVIDDDLLESIYKSYPVMWEDPKAKPKKCMMGCPHLSLSELYLWEERITKALSEAEKSRLAVETVMNAAPQVVQKFKADTEVYERLTRAGVRLADTCVEVYMNNPLCSKEAVITNSNKFREFTRARMFLDDELLEIMVSGEISGEIE